MTVSRLWAWGACLALAAALPMIGSGCSNGAVPVALEGGEFGDPSEVDLGDDPWRERRRMDLEQLERSLVRSTGGLNWMVGTRTGWEVYGDTLGVPDFINSSTEDLTVSLLFTKFLDDAARDTCNRLVNGREDAAAAARREVFQVDVTDDALDLVALRQQMASLLARFHGRVVAPDAEVLGPWTGLYSRVATLEGSSPQRGWQAVCVTLITHPDFFTY